MNNDLPTPAAAVRNLCIQARHGHLSSTMSHMHHRRAGFPFGALVDFAVDDAGFPLFCLSPLAIHTRNLSSDPRASVAVQMPGWSGLANARVTIFGEIYKAPEELQLAGREIFSRHTRTSKASYGSYVVFRMCHLTDIYFVGGFGTVQWVDVAEYVNTPPDTIVLSGVQEILQDLNSRYSDRLCGVLGPELLGGPSVAADDANVVSIDARGVDVRLSSGGEFFVQRLKFGDEVQTPEQAVKQLGKALDKSEKRLRKTS
mmetsp:Transcript_25717/g.84651  ORF Transcript_25717/g.84651 Transcript_25717/m.84651 type:complete len:258 (-) Transcript_25717:39-812(-)